jgi:hypothetical protein
MPPPGGHGGATGNSIAAVSKEANSQRRLSLPERRIPTTEGMGSSVREPEIASEPLS